MKIKYPIIVEGKYDKIKLDSLVEARVFVTDGFEIFKDHERLLLFKRLAEKSKIILLTDSDGGGHLIRSYLKTALKPEDVINLYIPRIEGKEKRKREKSKEGILGVEGIDGERLLSLLEPFSDTSPQKDVGGITKAELYRLGLSGRSDSSKRREVLLSHLGLPTNMSPNAMLSAINILYSSEELSEIASSLFSE